MPIDNRLLEYLKMKNNRKRYDEGVDPSLIGALSKSFSQMGTLGGKTSDTSAVENYSNILERKRELDNQRRMQEEKESNQDYLGAIKSDIEGERHKEKIEANAVQKAADRGIQAQKITNEDLYKKEQLGIQKEHNRLYGESLKSKEGKEKKETESNQKKKAEAALSKGFSAVLNLEKEMSGLGEKKKNAAWYEKVGAKILPDDWTQLGALQKNALSQASGDQGQFEDTYSILSKGRYEQAKQSLKPAIETPDFDIYSAVHEKTRKENANKLLTQISEFKRLYDPSFEPPEEVKEYIKKYHVPTKEIEYDKPKEDWKTGPNGEEFMILPNGDVKVRKK